LLRERRDGVEDRMTGSGAGVGLVEGRRDFCDFFCVIGVEIELGMRAEGVVVVKRFGWDGIAFVFVDEEGVELRVRGCGVGREMLVGCVAIV
jgi:hypothetical protein